MATAYTKVFRAMRALGSGVLLLAPVLARADGHGSSIATLKNPLGTESIYCFVKSIVDVVLQIGFVLVVFFLIYSGFLFVTAQGNEEKLKTAKTAFTWTVVGAALLLGAWVFANAIAGTVSNITGRDVPTSESCPE